MLKSIKVAELYQMSASGVGGNLFSKVDLIKLLKSELYFPTDVRNEIKIMFPRKYSSGLGCKFIFLFEELQRLAEES